MTNERLTSLPQHLRVLYALDSLTSLMPVQPAEKPLRHGMKCNASKSIPVRAPWNSACSRRFRMVHPEFKTIPDFTWMDSIKIKDNMLLGADLEVIKALEEEEAQADADDEGAEDDE